MNIRRTVIACVAALAVAGCTPADTDAEPDTAPAPATTEQVGDPAVFERIEGLTDCAAIQEQFDLAFNTSETADPGSAMHEAAVAYMDAANDRLGAVGC